MEKFILLILFLFIAMIVFYTPLNKSLFYILNIVLFGFLCFVYRLVNAKWSLAIFEKTLILVVFYRRKLNINNSLITTMEAS